MRPDPAPLPPPDDELAARNAWRLALGLALAWLLIALPLVPAYGATWDCVMSEYPYGERLLEYVLTGDEAFRSLQATEPRPPLREPHPDFDGLRDTWLHAYPIAALASALSCRVLWTELGWVPALAAHNLVIPLFVAGLILVLVRFAVPRVGALAAASAAVLLVGSPRFFANAFYNLKDTPETVLYVSATLLGFVALTRGGLRWWIGSGAVTGLALAAKANALFVPPQYVLFLLLVAFVPGLKSRGAIRWSWPGFLLGAVAVFVANWIVSPRFWSEPIAGPVERIGEVMRLGNTAFDQGVTGTARTLVTYAPLLVSTTTPPVVLALALVGLVSRRLPRTLRAFLVAGLVVTLGRNMLPGVRNYDGVRHFLEFYPYLCLLAGVGLASVADALPRALSGRAARPTRAVLVLACLAAPAWQSARTHPNGVGYFNAFIGGLEGAQARGLSTATDYWGNSYWQAFAWLNEHVEPGAAVLVPIAGHVGDAIAPVRLRSDLRLWRPNLVDEQGRRPITYVTFITRRGAYQPLMHALEERCEPVHRIGVQGGVLCATYRLDRDPMGDELIALWERKVAAGPATARILRWLREHPAPGREAWEIVRRRETLGGEETLRRLRAVLPEELHEGLEDVIWSLPKP